MGTSRVCGKPTVNGGRCSKMLGPTGRCGAVHTTGPTQRLPWNNTGGAAPPGATTATADPFAAPPMPAHQAVTVPRMDELERADAAYIAAVYVGMPTAEIEGDVDYYVGEVQRMAPLKTGSADQRMGYAEANVEGDLRVARLALDMRRAGHI